MQLYKQTPPEIEIVPITSKEGKEILSNIEKQQPGLDIIQNVDRKDALIRYAITALLLLLTIMVNSRLVIFTTPIMTYLLATAITRFCAFKYILRRYFTGPL